MDADTSRHTTGLLPGSRSGGVGGKSRVGRILIVRLRGRVIPLIDADGRHPCHTADMTRRVGGEPPTRLPS